MKLRIHDIDEVAKHLAYEEPTGSLSVELEHGGVCDFELPDAAAVRLEYRRAGMELFFRGQVTASVTGHCGRCLEAYSFELEHEFSLVLIPKAELTPELETDDVDVGFYQGEEVDLSPLVREQIILALPTRPLCREDCRGLCPRCGADRNVEPCGCEASSGDPRLAALRTLKVAN